MVGLAALAAGTGCARLRLGAGLGTDVGGVPGAGAGAAAGVDPPFSIAFFFVGARFSVAFFFGGLLSADVLQSKYDLTLWR